MSEQYWDLLGDGWNPGHTLTEEETRQFVTSPIGPPGVLDLERGILWRRVPAPINYETNE